MNIIVRIVVILIILAGALSLKNVLISSKPEQKSKKLVVVVPQVDSLVVELGDYQPSLNSFGTVQSYFETRLTPEVNGKIVSVSPKFRVGEMVSEGEVLATIDDADYQATLATQKANLILRKSALVEEEIRAKQAADDWKASGRDLSKASEFVLRKPQMAAARANIDAAQTAIDKAEVDLKRTMIKAPYNAVITARNASLGNYATAQSSLGTLVATEKAEVRIPLTAEQMGRVQFSEENKPEVILTIPSRPDVEWTAELTRMEPTIDPQNQVSYGIAVIDRPYSNDVGPLPVGSFVNVAIPASEIKDVYKVPESALVNDEFVWLLDGEDKLVRAEAERIQSDDGSVFVRVKLDDLESPIHVITRPLSNFRTGTLVKPNISAEK